MEPKLITLNLIYDYPVRWSKYKVLRDLIQNFYDSVTHQDWHKRFSYCRVKEFVQCGACYQKPLYRNTPRHPEIVFVCDF